jgi:hypothetical protein
VDINDSQEYYEEGNQATYNYTVSIYEDDDDLEVKVEDYSTSEDSQNITTMLKKASQYMEASEYELADAYDAYYAAKENLNKELGEFKEAIVYAEDVYVKIINYDSDSDNYKSNDITFRSKTTAKEKAEEVQAEAEQTESNSTSTNSTSSESSSSSSSSESSSSTTKVSKDYDDEDKKESYSVSAYERRKKSSGDDDDESGSKYYIIDKDTSVQVSLLQDKSPLFLQDKSPLFTSFIETDAQTSEPEDTFILATSSQYGLIWVVTEAGHKRVVVSGLDQPKATCVDKENLYVLATADGTGVVYKFKTQRSAQGKFVVMPERAVVFVHPSLLDCGVDEYGSVYILTADSLVRLNSFMLDSSLSSLLRTFSPSSASPREVVDASAVLIEGDDSIYFTSVSHDLLQLTHSGPQVLASLQEQAVGLTASQEAVFIATSAGVLEYNKASGEVSLLSHISTVKSLAWGEDEVFMATQDSILAVKLHTGELRRVAAVPGVSSVTYVSGAVALSVCLLGLISLI